MEAPCPKKLLEYIVAEDDRTADVKNYIGRGGPLDFSSEEHGRYVSPVFAAARVKHTGLLKLLLDAGANPNRVCLTSLPIDEAVKYDNLDAVNLLLEKGSHLAVPNKVRCPLLFRAKSPEMLDLLISKGISVSQQDYDGATILHVYASEDNLVMLAKALNLGVDPMSKDFLDRTPLYLAAKGGSLQTFEFILEWMKASSYEAGKVLSADSTKAPIIPCLSRMILGGEQMLASLYDLIGPDIVQIVNTEDACEGTSALLEAINRDNNDVALALIMYGADCTMTDRYGRNALVALCSSFTFCLPILKEVLAQGVKANDVLNKRICDSYSSGWSWKVPVVFNFKKHYVNSVAVSKYDPEGAGTFKGTALWHLTDNVTKDKSFILTLGTLLENGACPNEQGFCSVHYENLSPLIKAMNTGHGWESLGRNEVFKLLVAYGAVVGKPECVFIRKGGNCQGKLRALSDPLFSDESRRCAREVEEVSQTHPILAIIAGNVDIPGLTQSAKASHRLKMAIDLGINPDSLAGSGQVDDILRVTEEKSKRDPELKPLVQMLVGKHKEIRGETVFVCGPRPANMKLLASKELMSLAFTMMACASRISNRALSSNAGLPSIPAEVWSTIILSFVPWNAGIEVEKTPYYFGECAWFDETNCYSPTSPSYTLTYPRHGRYNLNSPSYIPYGDEHRESTGAAADPENAEPVKCFRLLGTYGVYTRYRRPRLMETGAF